jgi:phage shock protein C
MFCTRCGVEMDERVNYCSACGAATHNAAAQRAWPGSAGGTQWRLTRPADGKKIAGVCAGVARYFGWDVSVVRVIWALMAFWPPFVGVLAYIVCWVVMPKDPLLLMAPSAEASQAHSAQ